ncbi:type VI secretion system baseplate subunit TssG [Marinomonas fungiae]|uniref:type VI secretion system baseplate subunit TssG n=1 Tax=Marinomonas fungiae TaxID=1137284 RepID=UPI003A92EBFE
MTPSQDLLSKWPDMDFFQHLRVLESHARKRSGSASAPIGYDYPLYQEFIDFCVVQSLVSPYAAKVKAELMPEQYGFQKQRLQVACFGLTGPSGVLPQHYTEMLAQRQRDKDLSLSVLLDGFNARAISFLYRAWQKSRLAILEEQAQQQDLSEASLPTRKMLMSYTGLRHGATSPDCSQMASEDEDDLVVPTSEEIAYYFSGYFSQRPRNANALTKIMSHVLKCQVTLVPFFGRWFELDASQQNALGGVNCSLGQSFVIGSSVYEGGFSMRLKTEPLSFKKFQQIRPGGKLFDCLQELLLAYLGPDYWVDLQVVLKGHERPALTFGQRKPNSPELALGEGLWLSSEPAAYDVADTIYSLNR